ncbi:MAG: phosphoribosylformylglycinamidine synthase subunit PurL [Planctomycetaceae bacterium]|nr:phosphoribosylformylglycinamidine synthase subunit PurL [Planctomycetaceae bacterium]
MLWEFEIISADDFSNQEAVRVLGESQRLGCDSIQEVRSARLFLVQGELNESDLVSIEQLLIDPVTEQATRRQLAPEAEAAANREDSALQIHVLFKPGMTDNVAMSTRKELQQRGLPVEEVSTIRRYWFNADAEPAQIDRLISKTLANDAIERVVRGPLNLKSISLGHDVAFELKHVKLKGLNDEQLMQISQENLLSLSAVEMRTIQKYFGDQEKIPTDIELETIAQTWSEHCSHKTLAGRIRYDDGEQVLNFENMLKETIFAATVSIRESLGEDDWCVSVFSDNAGIVTFNETYDACFKVETHNRPSALEPYGGANTGIGGVIRDCLGTGLGGRPVANTDVFCFAPSDIEHDDLPPGVLHPKTISRGVVAGVRDYGNRMGIPTVNGAVYFDERYIGNPLVYCGNVAIIPRGKAEKQVYPGDYIVSIGGRTGLDGIHGATFSSAVLTDKSEETSGGAVQIGNAITEKMVADVVLKARDLELFTSITDCGAGGFSSAVGEMAEDTGAEVWLDQAPLKYSGLTYMEIWISEAQERMVFSVPPEKWEQFEQVCDSEGVEASILGKFTDTKKLVLKYQDQQVGELDLAFMHDGRPPIIREAVYKPREVTAVSLPEQADFNADLLKILASPNVCSKEWIIRQYDHEVQAGSVVKPLVGVENDGPSDAAVVQPDWDSPRGLVISNGMNPHYGDLDPYRMATSAIDEAMRNCIATGADPNKIAILDNFCWGNTDRPETLGALVRSALGCQDAAIAFGTPFISGKDSLHNEFTYPQDGEQKTVAIPYSLLISALGQIDDIQNAVTMDLKTAGNQIAIVGVTHNELGGSHYCLVNELKGGEAPGVDFAQAMSLFKSLHNSIQNRLIRSCHDLSEGGLAVAGAEMAFAGGLGLDLYLENLPADSLSDTATLFSESNSRFLIEVTPENTAQVEELFKDLPFAWIGAVSEEPHVSINSAQGKTLIQQPNSALKDAWQNKIQWD